MEPSETARLSLVASTSNLRPPATPALDSHERCDECGSPVEPNQRYCVVCGAHRRGVDDPAARYMTRATAEARHERIRAQRAAAGHRSRRTASGLWTALVLALVPVSAAVGVLVGRSS